MLSMMGILISLGKHLFVSLLSLSLSVCLGGINIKKDRALETRSSVWLFNLLPALPATLGVAVCK